jgi:hypothetical protein
LSTFRLARKRKPVDHAGEMVLKPFSLSENGVNLILLHRFQVELSAFSQIVCITYV